jgi:hypothetical protein
MNCTPIYPPYINEIITSQARCTSCEYEAFTPDVPRSRVRSTIQMKWIVTADSEGNRQLRMRWSKTEPDNGNTPHPPVTVV